MVDIKVDMDSFDLSTKAIMRKMDEACKETIKETCNDIEKMAKQFAPVRTGALRDSIKSKTDAMEGTVYSTARYAGYVENGTRYMKAQPFLRPAVDAGLKTMKERMVKNFK